MPFEDGKPDFAIPSGGHFEDEEPTSSLWRRLVADPALSLLKGAVGVPEAAVGLADIATGGYAGKGAEAVGFRPKEAKEYLDTLLSPEQQEANRRVQETKGFFPTIGAAIQNPSTIAHSVLESAPSIGAGGVLARGAMAAAPKLAPLVAGAMGEGVVSAGSTAEQIRQQTPTGTLSLPQTALAAGSGAVTGGVGVAGGKLMHRLGITDIDTLIAAGKLPEGAKKNIALRIAQGAFVEGPLEELPQSAQEQIAQNLALGKPAMEGVPEAGAMGMLAGSVMGGGVAAMPTKPAAQQILDRNQDSRKTAEELLQKAAEDVIRGTDTLGTDTLAGQNLPEITTESGSNLTNEPETPNDQPQLNPVPSEQATPETPAEAPAEAEAVIPEPGTIAPKTVGGIPVGAQSDEQLQAIEQDPDANLNSRRAAREARRARTKNPEERPAPSEVESPILETPKGAESSDRGVAPTQEGGLPEVTMADVEAVQDIPTTEKMRLAIKAVGEEEFQRQAQAKIAKYRPSTPDAEAMLVEATAINILAQPGKAAKPAKPAAIPPAQEQPTAAAPEPKKPVVRVFYDDAVKAYTATAFDERFGNMHGTGATEQLATADLNNHLEAAYQHGTWRSVEHPTQLALEKPAITPAPASSQLLDAIAKTKADLQTQLNAWNAKQYKDNRAQVQFEGDGPARNESMSIGAINENRKRKTIEALSTSLKSAENLEVTLQQGGPEADRLTRGIEDTWRKANEAAKREPELYKDVGALFEEMLLRDVIKMSQAGRGAIVSTPVSKIIRAAMESAVQPAPAAQPSPSVPKPQPEAAPAVEPVKEPAEPVKTPDHIVGAGKMVERFQGQYKKGMRDVVAKQHQKRLSSVKPQLVWTVEKSTIPEFPDRFDVVGREPAESSLAASPTPTNKESLQVASKVKAATDERLSNPDVRSELEVMAKEAGWAEVGGKLIRDQQGASDEEIAQRSAAVSDENFLTASEAVDRKTQQQIDEKRAADQLAGQGDIFSQPANTLSPADLLRAAADKMDSEAAAKPAPSESAKPEQPSGDTDATLSRFRPRQMTIFAKPYVGKTGAKLTGYEWKWTKEAIVDNRGEDRIIRVSDWEEAITNPETNRDIVHQFQIEKTDGEVVLVSAETAAKLLGVAESTARSSAKRLLEDEIEAQRRAGALEHHLDSLDKKEWSPTPAAAIEALGGALQRIWTKYKMWGDHIGKDDSYNYTQTNIDFTKGPKGYLALEAATDEPRGWEGLRLTPPQIWDKNGHDKSAPATPAPESAAKRSETATPLVLSEKEGSIPDTNEGDTDKGTALFEREGNNETLPVDPANDAAGRLDNERADASNNGRMGAGTGITAATLRAEISKAFGPKATAMVGDILIPLETQAEIANVSELSDVVPLIREGDLISGFYHPATGKTYAILGNLTPEGVKGLALHEIGVHYGLEGMLGKERYAQLSRQLDAMRKAGNKVVIEAHRQATEQAAKPNQAPEETIAYLVTNRPELPFVQRLIAQIKAFLFRKFGILGGKLTPDDIAALARASVLHASEGVRNGETQFARVIGMKDAAGSVASSLDKKRAQLVSDREALRERVLAGKIPWALYNRRAEEIQTQIDAVADRQNAALEFNADSQFSRAQDQTQTPEFKDIDRLPRETQDDIAYMLHTKVSAFKDMDESEVRANLVNMVDPVVVKQKTMNINDVKMAPGRGISDVAVKNMAKLGTTAPPILVDGTKLIEGGHRLQAAIAHGDKTISVVDVGPLLRADWSGWTDGKTNPTSPVRSNLSQTNTDIRFQRTNEQEGAVEAPSDPTPFHQANERLRERDQTTWDRAKKYMKRQFSPGGLLPSDVFAEKITRDSQFNAVEFDIRHYVGRLESVIRAEYKKKFVDLADNDKSDISRALAGDVSETIHKQTREAIYAMRQHIDNLSTQYADILDAEVSRSLADFDKTDARGMMEVYLKALTTGTQETAEDAAAEYLAIRGVDDAPLRKAIKSGALTKAARAQIIRGNIGEYVHRSYQAFDDKKWFQKLDDATIDNARQYLIDGYMDSEKYSLEDAEKKAEVTLHELVKSGTAYDSMGAFVREGKLGAKDLSIMIRRKQIAPEIRALLGEYKDARLNYAKSATKMGRLIWNQRFLDGVREKGMGVFLFEGDERPPQATTQISAESSEAYAPLNGLWTFPDVEQSFKDALGKERMDQWYETIVQLNGVVKFGKTILSPTTAARNWQSAFLFTVANGHFDLKHIAKSVNGLREYFTNQGEGQKLAYLRELQELGVVYDNPYAGEMMRLLGDSKLEDKLLRGKDPLKFSAALAYAQKFYQFGDDFWKIVGFENEKQMLIKHAGMNEADAKKEAAERIRNTYPTYSMVGRAMHFLRRFPLAGTFVSFPAEIVRTVGNMIRYMAQDYKDPKMRPLAIRRMQGFAIAAGFAYALQAMTKAMLGLDDDDEEAVRDLSPTWSKNSNFIFLGRDERGQLQYVDLSYVDPYNYFKRPLTAILRDQPWEKVAADVVREALEPFLGTDIAAGAIFEVMSNKKESGGKVYLESDKPWRQTAAIADHIRKTLQPGFASNLERTYKALSGQVSMSGKKYDPMEEAAGWAGWRMSTLDPKVALYYRTFGFTDQLREASSAFNQVARNPNEVSTREIKNAVEHSRSMRRDAFREMTRIIAAVRSSGISNAEIFRILRGNNVSQRDAAALIRGTVPVWRPTPLAARSAARRADALLGAGMSAEFAKRYREAMTVP